MVESLVFSLMKAPDIGSHLLLLRLTSCRVSLDARTSKWIEFLLHINALETFLTQLPHISFMGGKHTHTHTHTNRNKLSKSYQTLERDIKAEKNGLVGKNE